ncbi:MAG TPA: VCBS repeat-containing protein [Pyrinomonadaceae bacterium]|nr:VCBS repeat-containing protein [Pyrinomonadaceae bacterium]
MKQILKNSKKILPKQFAFFGLCCLLSGIFGLASANTVHAQTTQKPPVDFNGDGKSDFALGGLARQISPSNPSQLVFYIQPNTYPNQPGLPTTNYQQPFGLVNLFDFTQSDIPVPEDFDGDGKSDIAVWRPRNGQCGGGTPSNDKSCFYVLLSQTGAFRAQQFGRPGDIPTVSGDYDGDNKADFAVYRRAEDTGLGEPCFFNGTANGGFYFNPSTEPSRDFRYRCWGQPGDNPMKGDFNGDKRLDYVVQRIGNNLAGVYLINYSNTSLAVLNDVITYGFAGDLIAPGDYDGDGRTDIAVFRETGNTSTSNYSISIRSTATGANLRYDFRYGYVGDIPAPGDYNGDGKMDIGMYRQNDGIFYTTLSSLPASSDYAVRFGKSSDLPIAAYNLFF